MPAKITPRRAALERLLAFVRACADEPRETRVRCGALAEMNL